MSPAPRLPASETSEPDDAPRWRGPHHVWSAVPPTRRRVVALAVALTVVGVALATWWGVSATVGKPGWRQLAYDVRSPREVVVRFEVTKPADRVVRCVVDAQETAHATVGRTEIDVPASAPRTSVQQVTVRTTSLAVIGQVDSCRVV